MAKSDAKHVKMSRPKIFSILSLIAAIDAGYYFIHQEILYAVVFTAMASIFDSAGIGSETQKQKNWHPPLKNHPVSLRSLEAFSSSSRKAENEVNGFLFSPQIKNALDRIADAAIFIGFMMSGTVSQMWGAIALVLVIVLPYWVKLIWKISIRRFFHALLIARVVYFIVYGV